MNISRLEILCKDNGRTDYGLHLVYDFTSSDFQEYDYTCLSNNTVYYETINAVISFITYLTSDYN